MCCPSTAKSCHHWEFECPWSWWFVCLPNDLHARREQTRHRSCTMMEDKHRYVLCEAVIINSILEKHTRQRRCETHFFSYIRCREAVIEGELNHAESRQEGGILMLYLRATCVSVQKCQANVWAFFSGEVIARAARLEDASAQAHWTCPVVVAPEVASRVMTRCIIHCWCYTWEKECYWLIELEHS